MHLPDATRTRSPTDGPDRARPGLIVALPLAAILLLAALGPLASAAHVEPTKVPADKRIKDCTHFAPSEDAWKEIRLNPVREGLYKNDDISITVTEYTAKTFSWTANRSIVEAVYVRGGNNDASYLYEYDPASGGDTDLTTPRLHYNEIQFASFCYAEQPGEQETPCVEVIATAEAGPSNHIEWIPVEDADSYNVYRAVAGGSFELLTTTDASTLEHDDTDVEQGETYKYRVTAMIDGEETDFCNTAEVTAIPVFPSLAALASAAVLGLVGYAVIRRRT